MPIRLTEMMADKGPLWDEMVKKYGLRPHRFEEIASWRFSEFVFRVDHDVISDITKARRYGFHEVVETIEKYLHNLYRVRRHHWRRLRARRSRPASRGRPQGDGPERWPTEHRRSLPIDPHFAPSEFPSS